MLLERGAKKNSVAGGKNGVMLQGSRLEQICKESLIFVLKNRVTNVSIRMLLATYLPTP